MKNFISKIPIDKGWSGDKKYRVEDIDGNVFLLRISPVEHLESRRTVFEQMQKVEALNVPMCRPIEMGVCDEGVYMLQSWINGFDAEELIPTLSDDRQYAFGLDAGSILKKIHSIPAPDNMSDWGTRFDAKINRKLDAYGKCPIKYENGQLFVDFIKYNRHLIKERPQCYQHGDYHIGNMMIENDKLYIIDFDRNDYGDPWEEFNRIVWCVQTSPVFAKGIVDGYFDNDVPEIFWRLLALYISVNTLSSLPWALPFGDNEIRVMQNQAAEVLNWYNNMTSVIPTWYKEVL